MEYQHITYELRNQTAWIHLNRPADMNAISADEMMARSLIHRQRSAISLRSINGFI